MIFHCYFNLCFPDHDRVGEVLNMHAGHLDFFFFELFIHIFAHVSVQLFVSLSICKTSVHIIKGVNFLVAVLQFHINSRS